jgi:hypothetical protein
MQDFLQISEIFLNREKSFSEGSQVCFARTMAAASQSARSPSRGSALLQNPAGVPAASHRRIDIDAVGPEVK